MFRLTYRQYDSTVVEDEKDIDGIVQSLISIMNNESAEQEAIDWCCTAKFGDHFVNQRYHVQIDCYSETKNKLSTQKVKGVIEKISNESHVKIKYRGNDGTKYIFDVAIGMCYITYDYGVVKFEMHSIGSDESEICPVIYSDSPNIFMSKAICLINKLKKNKPFEVHSNFQDIADTISGYSGISNEWIGVDNDSLTIDFSLGTSYMKNCGGKGLFFALNDENGKEVATVTETDKTKFINSVMALLKGLKIGIQTANSPDGFVGTSLPNRKIIEKLKEAAMQNKETHFTIYKDKIWKIDIERHPYGTIRMWVSREDKYGNFNQALISIYNRDDGPHCVSDFKVKQSVANKAISTYKALVKEGLIQ